MSACADEGFNEMEEGAGNEDVEVPPPPPPSGHVLHPQHTPGVCDVCRREAANLQLKDVVWHERPRGPRPDPLLTYVYVFVLCPECLAENEDVTETYGADEWEATEGLLRCSVCHEYDCNCVLNLLLGRRS
jgi:hypothetical protein